MRRIVDGVEYNTDLSEEIARASHGEIDSDASWTLYRTTQGVFFEVVGDEDGILEGVYPLSDGQAKMWLEKNANRLVGQYFEASSPTRSRFSRNSVIAAIEVLESAFSQAKLTRFLLRLGPNFVMWVGDETVNMPARANKIIGLYDQKPARRLDDGRLFSDALIEAAAVELSGRLNGDNSDELRVNYLRALTRDGFNVVDGAIQSLLPDDVDLPKAENEITTLLRKYQFLDLLNHLNQASEAHSRGHWEAANGQIRSFYEGLFERIATRIDPASAKLETSENRRSMLADIGFLRTARNEWGPKANFVNALLKRLHPDGSHPGSSDEEDSTFRRHIVLIVARSMLVRFDKWPLN